MPGRPNILFIFTDQQRLSAAGAYGETPCRTPAIDRLAGQGTLFENAYTVYPVCSPARGTIMTGVYPHTHGITSNIHEVGCSVHELQDRPTLLPRRLQAAGYATGYTGKWHLGTDRPSTFEGGNRPSLPSTVGFEGQDFPGHGGDGKGYSAYRKWAAQKGYAHKLKPWAEPTRKVRAGVGVLDLPLEATVPYYLVDMTIELIERFRARNTPFFIALNFWGPHTPYYATQEFVDLYRDVEIPPWPNYEWPSRETPGPHHLKIHWDKESLSWADWAVWIRYYYARMSMIDSQIGRLQDYLSQQGLLDDTAVIFTADHGETSGSHGGLLDKGWHHFEETHRIPFVVRLPGGAGAGARRAEFVSLADVYPTVLDLAGADWDREQVHGRSLVPLIRGEAREWRDAVVTEFLGLGNVGTCMKTIRMGNLKYGCNMSWPDELYDLDTDPHEMVNRIDDPGCADALEQLRDRLEQWMTETRDPALRMFQWRRRKSLD
ncbi:MAG: sulfatase-like hydrolase/transferase [Kiritimatiellae bacterium]|nr:sulfatase-like hydrolase/transferase [Kiritimatiellia bacterium]